MELLEGPKPDLPVELLLVGPVAPLDPPIALGVPPPDIPVGVAEVVQVPDEVGPELGTVIGLDLLDGHGESTPHSPPRSQSRTLRYCARRASGRGSGLPRGSG